MFFTREDAAVIADIIRKDTTVDTNTSMEKDIITAITRKQAVMAEAAAVMAEGEKVQDAKKIVNEYHLTAD